MRFGAPVIVLALFSILWSAAAPAGTSEALDAPQRGVPVFTYHMVDTHIPRDRIGNALTITPAQFEAQLRTLRRLGVRTMTAIDLIAALRRGVVPRRSIVMTFDDGYRNARTVVLPLLERYRDVATFYVISGTVGTVGHLTWHDIRDLHAAGMEIGAHGREHVDLTELGADGQLAEADACIHALRRWGNIVPETYAYPSGRYNAITIDVMRRAGMLAAFTEDYGYARSAAAPYRMPRIRILRESAEPLFTAVVSTLAPVDHAVAHPGPPGRSGLRSKRPAW